MRAIYIVCIIALLGAMMMVTPAMAADLWVSDSAIVSGLGDVGGQSAPDVFSKDGTWYLISGEDSGWFNGYKWNGSAWQSDPAIVSGLEREPGSGWLYTHPTLFNMDGTWYLISGNHYGDFFGFYWHSKRSRWLPDSDIVSGLGDVGEKSAPDVFNKDGTWYLISGERYGGFEGYKWNGSAWQPDPAIVSGLGNVGTHSTPAVFNLEGTWYLISGEGGYKQEPFNGYRWTGSEWEPVPAIVSGLPDIDWGRTTPAVFYKDGTWVYLISGESYGGFYGWHYQYPTTKPDLIPTSLQPTTLHLDQPGTLTATIRNDGGGNASAFNVSLKLGETLIDTKTVDALNTDEEKTVDFTWTPTSPGMFNMTVTADPENVIDEFDETNNVMTITVTVERASTPFLVSGMVNYENGDAASNLFVTVTNQGTSEDFTVKTATASNYYCALTDSRRVSVGDTIRITTTDGTNSNETSHTVTADDINSGGFGEDLALATTPDLIISRIALKTPGYANEQNVLGVGVKNIGGADAGLFRVSFLVDGTPMGEQTVSSLAVGETAEFEYIWTPAGTGDHALSAAADVNSEVEESDEMNNDLARTSVIIKPTDWPQFHYDIVHTGFSPCSAPDTNETLWISDDISAIGGTSTVVAEGKVFAYSGLTGLDSGDSTLYCLDESTGAMLWNTSIPAPAYGSWSSPAYHDGKVFTSTDIEAGCYNATTGEQIWVFGNPTNEPSVNGGPVVADGKVIVNDWQAGHYYCLDEETGELLWTFTEEQTGDWNVGYTQGVPAYEDGKFYITTWIYVGGNVYCIDADTGDEIWHQTTPLDTCGSPAVVDGTVYVTNYNFYGDGKIYAMDAADGTILWHKTIQRSDSTPAVAYGNVYVTGGARGFSERQTYCFNTTTGDLVWETNVSDTIGAWTCSVAVADGKVFVGTEGGDFFDYAGTYALDAFTGDVVWSYPQGGSSPAVANNIVFTIGGGRVCAFGGSEIPAGVTFDLNKLDLNSSGIIKAFITLPEGYDVADIDVSTVECEGAHAFGDGSVIPGKQALEVKFRIQDMVDVPTGDAVSLSVTGELTTGERFEGSDMVEVTAK